MKTPGSSYRARLRTLGALFRAHPITGPEVSRAWGRFFWWQLRRRLTSRPMPMRFARSATLLVFPGQPASTAAWYFRLPDFEEMLFAVHLLRPGDLFVDGGANVGVWSVLAASTGAEVLAIEPVPEAYRLLEQQRTLNNFSQRFDIAQCALAACQGTLRITSGRGPGNQIVDAGSQLPSTETTATPLDILCEHRRPVLLKLDLEGYELEALRGAGAVLAAEALLGLIVETFRPQNWRTEKLQAIEALLREHGFRPYGYRPQERLPYPITSVEQSGQNTIYLRDENAVRHRVQEAAGIRLGSRQW